MAKPRLKPTVAQLWGSGASMASHVAAGSEDTAVRGWFPALNSADADLISELDTLSARARDLERNNGYVTAGNRSHQDNIIGHQLIATPQPDMTLLGWEPEQAAEWARNTRARFQTWANVPNEFDASRSQTLRAMSMTALSAWFMNGNALAIPMWIERPGATWRTRMMHIEADRLETPPFLAHRRNIRKGKEVDRYGAPVAYWIRRTHPGDGEFYEEADIQRRYFRVPAFTSWGRPRVIHLYDKERPGQSVGKPIVTSVMRELRMLSHYGRVELETTIANSLVGGILESNLDSQAVASLLKATSHDDVNTAWQGILSNWNLGMRPGANLALPVGAKFTPFTPNRPNSAFEAFVMAVLHNISAGLNIPYEILTKDFTHTSYSSARAALLEAWRYFLARRKWMSESWFDPIYMLWLEEAVDARQVKAPGFYKNVYAYGRVRWTMTGRGWVDENKEAQGAMLRRRARITTLDQETSIQGGHWEDNVDQIAIEEAYLRKRGVELMLPEAQFVTTDNLDKENKAGEAEDPDQEEAREDADEAERDEDEREAA